jgi:FKBP-type peptidyl-prolyl cis-trans isomerase SlyD
MGHTDMKVGSGAVVSVDYRLHLGDGEVVDESEPGKPLHYLHGGGQIVPGLEKELEGLSTGDSRKVVVPPKEGYGEHDPRGVQQVPRSAFPSGQQVEAGMEFLAQSDDGQPVPVSVREVRGDTVLIDINHPLAGKTLHFDVTVRGVRPATQEELQHGHIHGPGGAH